MKQEQKAVIKREVLAMSQLIFLICRTYLITLMTIGMMASLTDFRLKGRKLLRILILYSIWCIVSSAMICAISPRP